MKVLLELTKAKITVAVTVSVATGFFMFTGTLTTDVIMPAVGVFLLACGSAALNQVQEAKVDGLMSRTRTRPIPSGRISRDWALFISLAFIGAGMYVLSCIETHTVTLLALGGLAVVWYNGIYIMLKRITAFAVIPGSLVGAIPPVIGWAAAGGVYSDATILEVALFFIMWQIPHFWLMLLMFSSDYEQAGLPSLTRVFSKEQIARITTVWILAVAATGIVLAMRGQVHLPWNGAIVLASLWLAYKALGFLRIGKSRSAYFPAFMRINVYALFVMIFLMMNAFF